MDKICADEDWDEDAVTTYAPSTASMLDPTGTIRNLLNTTQASSVSDEDDCSILAATAVTFVCGVIQVKHSLRLHHCLKMS